MERVSRGKELGEDYPIGPPFESHTDKAFGFRQVGVDIRQLGSYLNGGNTNRRRCRRSNVF
jgi:hypothetical protein